MEHEADGTRYGDGKAGQWSRTGKTKGEGSKQRGGEVSRTCKARTFEAQLAPQAARRLAGSEDWKPLASADYLPRRNSDLCSSTTTR
eukprot:763420-Hanusia_phi.AAC.1